MPDEAKLNLVHFWELSVALTKTGTTETQKVPFISIDMWALLFAIVGDLIRKDKLLT